ncbi:DUF5518 domain-containing protein [Salinigranum sp.]|uniref:DUF5518 domain-containing protein n=1 Tax=Salinigranum sp. TaxID=1966351 RepID=UPI003562CFE0
MTASDSLLASVRTGTWRYALVGGVVSIPLTIGLNWYAGTPSHFSLNMVVVGGLVAGYLAKRDAVEAKLAGVRAGLVGAAPGLVWFLRGIISRMDTALSAEVAVVAAVGVGVVVLGIGAIAGLVGGAVGGWLFEQVRHHLPPSGS